MEALPHRTQCPDPESQSALGRGVLPRAQNWKVAVPLSAGAPETSSATYPARITPNPLLVGLKESRYLPATVSAWMVAGWNAWVA